MTSRKRGEGELQSFPLGEKEPKEKESKGEEKESKMAAKAERKSARIKALIISNAAFVVPILMDKYYVKLAHLDLSFVTPLAEPAALPGLAGFQPIQAYLHYVAGLRVWQVANAAAFCVNVWSVSSGGRIDSSYADKGGVPPTDEYRSLVTPSGWAFAIWGVIYLAESVFMVVQMFPFMSEVAWLAEVSPWFIAANVFQSLWCAAFRDWARPSSVFWISAAMLTSTALALGGAQAVYTRAGVIAVSSWATFGLRALVQFPLSLHFGWTTAAAIVNWNSYFAVLYRDKHISLKTQVRAAFGSIHLAYIGGAALAVFRGDFLYSLTIAWALRAIEADKGRKAQGLVDEKTLDRFAKTAGFGAKLCLGVSACVFARVCYNFVFP
mmetsp:Transcript_21506/g.35970  ORF Transcript_21506/g.35970 Transcript_21506/m.35970 type:complete len:381 (+) Transcript_21506:157-1299(+)|eukprot:CAMPEP_0198229196 /NCGR_PEP_ID=MMETSP1445-20131203/113996_1 /TAXON_ID=36898 /ORGANISM="Pyramimonas sp., Strain CCMP2087" /LENGTH=380 /DNA_ID=CAMNT_0043909643 /DNA_START=157 /DNA_END=1299 /DNA_ORIENTATION=+